MESYLTLISIVLVFVTSHNKATFAEKSVVEVAEHTFTKVPYVFPEIHDGNALQPTLDLLLSQQQYREEMARIYQKMEKKKPEAHYLTQLSVLLKNTDMMMNGDIENVQDYIAFGVPDDETKKQPWCGTSSFGVLNSWRKLKEWNGKMRGEGLDTEIDVMEKVVDVALAEMEIYQKYADVFYEEMKTTTEEDSGSEWVG